MGIEVQLHGRDGERITSMADPNGGTFDTAGDFDDLIGATDLTTIGRLDPYGDVTLDSADMSDLIADVDHAMRSAQPGPQLRGLRRLRRMAQLVQADESLTLRFVGD